jgi:hydrogenase maturation protease
MLMADDGIGLAALARLQDEWFIPPSVELIDGGTWGMNLLPIIESAERLLVLDAIDAGEPPGVISELHGSDVPRFLAQKLSPHQIDLREVLALAELRGTLPAHLVALGAQPGRVEMSTDLSQEVVSALDGVVERSAAVLRGWGVQCFQLLDVGRKAIGGAETGVERRENDNSNPVPMAHA